MATPELYLRSDVDKGEGPPIATDLRLRTEDSKIIRDYLTAELNIYPALTSSGVKVYPALNAEEVNVFPALTGKVGVKPSA